MTAVPEGLPPVIRHWIGGEYADAADPPVILISRGVQAHLLELLGIDETRPRWLET